MDAGTFFEAVRDLPEGTLASVTGGRPFVVLSPHPDDESLGVGGVIAAACAANQRVDVVVVSDGAGSHPRSTRFPPDALVRLRKMETARAAAALGLSPARLTHLDLPDTAVPLRGPAFEAAVDRIAAVMREAGARTLLVTWGRDPHCDHEAVDAMAKALRARDPDLKLWSYAIWGRHLAPDTPIDEPRPTGYRIDVTPWLAAKHAAIAAHASQMTDLIDDDPDGFRFTPDTLAPFLEPVETLFEVPR